MGRRTNDLNSTKSKAQLDFIYIRDKGICQLCGARCLRIDASREHIIPLRKNGSNDNTNIVLAHKWCNNKKG